MNVQRFIIAVIGVMIFVFAFEFLWHGNLMMGLYEATKDVWRPMEESNQLFMFGSQLLFALVFVFLYTKIYKAIPCKIGLLYGLGTGALMAAPELASYAYMPIPMSITFLWMLATLLKSVGAGLIVGAIYKDKQ